MHIVVCAKQVPDTSEIKIDSKTGSLLREGAPSILNPDDAHALETALSIKDTYPDARVTVLTMGPAQAKDVLIEAIAMGADDGVLVNDSRLAESDTWATAYALACAVKKLAPVDLLLTGRQASDGVTAQVGPELAEQLDMPQATCVDALESIEEGGKVQVHVMTDQGHAVMRLPLPALLTVTAEMNKPRYMSMAGIFRKNKPIQVWNAEEAGIDPDCVGLAASMTKVIDTYQPPRGRGGRMIPADDTDEAVAELLVELKELQTI